MKKYLVVALLCSFVLAGCGKSGMVKNNYQPPVQQPSSQEESKQSEKESQTSSSEESSSAESSSAKSSSAAVVEESAKLEGVKLQERINWGNAEISSFTDTYGTFGAEPVDMSAGSPVGHCDTFMVFDYKDSTLLLKSFDVSLPAGYEAHEFDNPSFNKFGITSSYARVIARNSETDTALSVSAGGSNAWVFDSKADITKDSLIAYLVDDTWHNEGIQPKLFGDKLVFMNDDYAYVVNEVIKTDDYVIIPYLFCYLDCEHRDREGWSHPSDPKEHAEAFNEFVAGINITSSEFKHYTEGDITQDLTEDYSKMWHEYK